MERDDQPFQLERGEVSVEDPDHEGRSLDAQLRAEPPSGLKTTLTGC
jgi:hypothetical protein